MVRWAMTTGISSYPTQYPTDVSGEEWAFVAPHLTLLPLDDGQRRWAQTVVGRWPYNTCGESVGVPEWTLRDAPLAKSFAGSEPICRRAN